MINETFGCQSNIDAKTTAANTDARTATTTTAKRLRISYNHNRAEALASVFTNNVLVYLELIGLEPMVKAITAVLMQGVTFLDKHSVYIESVDRFNVNKSGNRRLIEPIGEGYAHCVFFHESVLPKQGMSVLLADKEEGIFTRFRQWLQEACPLPGLSSLAKDNRLERDLFSLLKNSELIAKAYSPTGDKIAYSIDTERLFKDDYALLREAIIDTLERFYNETDSFGFITRREVIEALAEQKAKEAQDERDRYLCDRPLDINGALCGEPQRQAA